MEEMSNTALAKRELTASKLKESVRQLRRYLDSGSKSKRTLEKKCDKVESEKDELLEDNYYYAKKSDKSLEDEDIKNFLTPILDEAEDILNEAMDVLEDFNSNDAKELKKAEIATLNREAVLSEELIMYTIEEASKILIADPATEDDVIEMEHFLKDLEEKEELLKKSLNILRELTENDEDVETYSKTETKLARVLSAMYKKMNLFIKKNCKLNEATMNVSSFDPDVRSSTKASIRLEKIKPPSFSGNIRNFARFKADFEAVVKPAYDDEMYLTYVLKETCLTGPAYELVKNVETEKEVWMRLEEKYGDTIEIVDAVIHDVQGVSIKKFDQDKGVVQLVDVLEKGVRDLTAIGKLSEIANAYTVKLVEQKLPRRVMMKWLDEEDKMGVGDRFEALFAFLKLERKRLEKLIQQSGVTADDSAKRRIVNLATKDRSGGDKRKNCVIHENSDHFTRKCKSFLSKTVAERVQIINDKKACILCLSLSHVGEPCPWKSKWDPCGVNGCAVYHSRLLHANSGMSANGCKATTDGEQSTLLLIQKMKTNSNNDVTVFWDSGSSISLVRKDYAMRNNLSGFDVSYELVTLGNVRKLQNTVLFDVPIVDMYGNTHVIKAYGIEEICHGDENVDIRDVIDLFPDLREKDVRRRHKEVEILIGMDYAYLHPEPKERRHNLVLYRSKFGTGKLLGGYHDLIKGRNELNMLAVTVAHARSIKIEVIKPKTEVDFFTAEGLGINVPPKCKKCKACKECTFQINELSLCEQRELEVIKQNLKLDSIQNKWITTYPYKTDPATLIDNRYQVEMMLRRTEKRLSKDVSVKEQYCNQFQDFVDRGVFREIPEKEMNEYQGAVCYISHHEVYKEGSASTPVRIVLNTSLKNKDGLSLNDVMMKGPNSLNNLFGIQMRFRTYQCALVGDIAKMYNSIDTTLKERHLRRVLWRNMKTDEAVRTFGTEKVMFGDKPAAAICATAIAQTAERFRDIDEEAAAKISKDIYVDDITTGASDVTEATKLKENISKILSKGGFRVKGFIMSGDSSQEILSLLGSGEVGRILGIGWRPTDDEFVIRVRINASRKFKGARKDPDLDESMISSLADGKLTRRMLLSITNSCYDPLGIVSPITVQLKIELRKLYSKELGLGWDDDLPHVLKMSWVKLVKLLKSIDGMKYRRSVHDPDGIGDPELIVFCDGSPLAMSAAAYIRWKLNDGKYSTYLFAAKTRVTPIERITIPRAEMQAGVMAVRLGNSIANDSGYNFENMFYISDSECTLASLKKDSVALKEFFGNRVSEINASTTNSQWYHCKSHLNIADLATRMTARPCDIEEQSAWQRGPEWLRRDQSCWPVSQEVNDVIIPEDELIKRGTCFYAAEVNMLMDVKNYSSYSFLMNVTARLFAIFENKTFRVKELSISSLEKAERYWLKVSMQYTKSEVEKGRLASLRPQVDKEGIIVLGSRADKGLKYHYNTESFPILTNKDPLSYLWMKMIHEEDHSGVTKTVAKSRRKYWIVRGRRLAEKVRYSCYRCKLIDKKLASQLMAPLPLFRQTIAPVFNVTSIDLFGPFLVKDMVKKRVKMKVWGLIATCASVRAVHLDIAEGYGTDAVIQTLRKFVALRGCPSKFISDQGSQLITAAKDTANSTETWDWSSVEKWATNHKITWKFVPADSQHENGLSESMIKSVKRSIKHVLGENVLSFSEFQLMLYEVANIINTRPIGVISGSDPEFPNPITPNDLILGRSTNQVPQGPFEETTSITRRFVFVQKLIDEWWKVWFSAVLPTLVPCYRWMHKYRNVKLGDICLIKYKGLRATYRLGRVLGVHHGEDGLVRKIKLEYKLPTEKSFRTVERSIHGVSVIVPIEDQSNTM